MSKISCPNCQSKNTCRIQYGMPEYTDKLEKDIQAGRVHLGGCVISGNDPNRYCNDCRAEFDTKATNIYLDIDGVLLANEENLAIGAAEFIKYAADNFDVYWLTTHCMDGTTDHAIEYLQRGCDEYLRPWLEKFKPVTWSLKKTEAIDFTKPFMWFDDDCFSGEKIDLHEHGVFNSWIEVNLAKYPDQMVHELKLLKSIAEEKATI